MCVRAQGHTKGASQTEIRQLEVAIRVDQQVLRLQVAVQHTVSVAVSDSLAQLHHELLDHLRSQGDVQPRALGQRLAATTLVDRERLHVLLQIDVEVLEDEVELVTVGVYDVQEAHNVLVVHLLEQGDLADGSGRHAFVFGLEPDLLEGDDALVLGRQVLCLVDDSVRACQPVLATLPWGRKSGEGN